MSELNQRTDFQFKVSQPYDWDYLYSVLYSHRLEGVESFRAGRYRRTIRLGSDSGALEVQYRKTRGVLSATIFHSGEIDRRKVRTHLSAVFDIQADPEAHRAQFVSSDAVSELYFKNPGIRVPGAWDGFETAVCIILAQLVSLTQARAMTERLIGTYGLEIKNPIFPGCNRHFPPPEVLMNADLSRIGLAKLRQSAVRDLSALVYEGGIDLSPSADSKATRKTLLAIRGIGKWTAEMIALRCLGDRNAFPSTDLVVKRALLQHNLPKGNWTPWNAYIILAIWKTYVKAFNPANAPANSCSMRQSVRSHSLRRPNI